MIDRLTRGRPASGDVVVGPGDDGAVVAAGDGRVVVSTDMLVEGRHFRLDWSTPHDVGRKAVAQNAADIEAMGARVTAFVVGFGAPADTPAAQVNALADGMWDEAGRFGAGIVGGDLVSSPQWVVSVTVLGDLGGLAPVLRSGARPVRSWPSPVNWAIRPRDTRCGTKVLIDSTSCGSAIWCRSRHTGRVGRPPRPARRR